MTVRERALTEQRADSKRITHACKLVGPQDGRSEAASSPPGNHISSSNEAELQMVLVRKTPARIDHRNRANGESEIYMGLPPAKKRPRSLPTHLIHPPTLCNQYHHLHVTSLTDRESPSPNNNLDDDNPYLPLSTFLLPHSIISSLLQHRHLRLKPRRRTSL